MKNITTLIKHPSILIIGLMFLLNGAFAQTYFSVTSPAGIAGNYDYTIALFGGEHPGCSNMDPISGELIIVDDEDDEGGNGSVTDACQAVQNDLTGKIALIDRGSCSFDEKILNAQNAGAIMVVMCNNIVDPATINMSVATQSIADQVTIPAVMLSLADCATIRAEIPGAAVSMVWEPVIPSDDVVLWDGGQFDGGLGDWTTNAISPDTAFWTWSADGSSDNGHIGNGNIVYSPTYCNGAAIFDANVYNAAASGGSPPYPMFTGELISPVIDCSTFDYVSLKFYTHNLRLNGNTRFFTSIDGGTTWDAGTIITTENVFTATETNLVGTEIKRYLISEFAGEANCRVKFEFSGDFYFFILDDVQLIEPERNNLAIMENFYAIPPNTMTPTSQLEEFSFLADVANLGAVEQPNVTLNVSIIDNTTSQEVFNEDLSYGGIPADSLVENEPFTAYFIPDGSITSYRGTYEVSSDSVDFDPSDNFRYFDFETTDTTFAKEFGATSTIQPAASNWEGEGEPHSWAFGNSYHVVNGDDWWASTVTFGIATPSAEVIGRLITIYLYRWDEDTNEDGNMDDDERTPVGFHVYEIIGDETTEGLITVPLSVFPSGEPGPIDIDSDQTYAVMVEYSTNDEIDFVMAGSSINYAAMSFRSELDGIPEGNARYGYLLGVNGDLSSEAYSSAGFNNPIAPVVRLNITSPTGIDEQLDAANIIEISPNPANNKINLKVDLLETLDKATVRIFDVNGRLILDQPYENIKTEQLEYDISNFANGAYFLRFITKNGVRVERFIVQH